MLIKKVKINGFGKLKNKEIKFKPGLNVIFGPNSSGKTTLAYFLLNSLSKPGNEIKKYEPWNHFEFGGEISTDEGDFKVDFLNGEFNSLVDRELLETIGFIMEDEKLDTIKEKDAFVISYMKKRMQKNEWGLKLTDAINKTDEYANEIQLCIENISKQISEIDSYIDSVKEKIKNYNNKISKKNELKRKSEQLKQILEEKEEEISNLKREYIQEITEKINSLKTERDKLNLNLKEYLKFSKIDRDTVSQAKELLETIEVLENNIKSISSQLEELENNFSSIENTLNEKMRNLNIENEKDLEKVNLKIKNLSLLKKLYDEKKTKLENILEENPLWKLFTENEEIIEEVEKQEAIYRENQAKIQNKIEENEKVLKKLNSSIKVHKDFSFVFFFAAIISLLLGFVMRNINIWLFFGAAFTGFIGLFETILWRKIESRMDEVKAEIQELTKKKMIRPTYLSILKDYNLKSIKELRQKYYEFIEWKTRKKEYNQVSEEFKNLESEILRELKDFNLGSAAQIIDSGIAYLEKLYNDIQKLLLSKSSIEREIAKLNEELERMKAKREESFTSLNKMLEELKISIDEIKDFENIYNEYLKIKETITKIDSEIEKFENILSEEIYPEYIMSKIYETEKLRDELNSYEKELQEDVEKAPEFSEILENLKKRDELSRKLETLKGYYSNIEVSKQILQKNLEEYVETYGKKFKEEFTKILLSITNEPLPLIVEENLSVRLNINGEKLNPNEFLSAATFDQLLFAYKIALYRTMSEHNLPLVIDNALIRYDNTRLQKTLEILDEESKRRQIILLTSDERLKNKFKEALILEG
ncbi:DNA repair exonuclease SbcCD ATPase subunit [Thermosipho japonicus]|uniref:DNA repair exonuclease SbcCD ATPase subunit n=1 Tax=Thermosipho japonicus TaxID=90323 RepID=A0A841GJT9_9BACT|nr:AAA family ATPase [Thermosipho japonicus]MBB6062627.1 DNA repair exonuclease SbcCD ATPase subunit [Thermosipho japonicus]